MVWKGLSVKNVWYQWHFIKALNLLLVLPKDLPDLQLRLWKKILVACDLAAFSGEQANFMFSSEGLDLLIEHFHPKWTWLVSSPDIGLKANASTKMIFTEHYSTWFQYPRIKQQIWHQWLVIQDRMVSPS